MSRKNRKARKRAITLAGGAVAKPRPVNRGRPPQEDATKTAIDARIRHHNAAVTEAKDRKDPAKAEDRKAMSDPMQSCAIGRALTARAGDDMMDLWRAVEHMQRTDATYRRAMGFPPPHAKVAGILAPTEAMETSADAPAADLRTDEERVRSATSAHMAVEGWLGWCDKHAASSARQAVIFAPDDPIRDLPAVLRALQCVVDGMAGRRMIWRAATSG